MTYFNDVINDIKKHQARLIETEKEIEKALKLFRKDLNKDIPNFWKLRIKGISCEGKAKWNNGGTGNKQVGYEAVDYLDFTVGSRSDNWNPEPIVLFLRMGKKHIFPYRGKWIVEHYDHKWQGNEVLYKQIKDVPYSVKEINQVLKDLSKHLGINVVAISPHGKIKIVKGKK